MSTDEKFPLTPLLTPEENQEITLKFDQFDKNGDGQVTRVEYINSVKRLYEEKYNGPVDDQEIERECDFWLKLRDFDGDGIVEWEEFLEYEAIFQLEKRNKNTLVELLNDDEMKTLKHEYDQLDIDHSGGVSKVEAEVALQERFGPYLRSGKMTEGQVNRFTKRQMSILNKADDDSDGYVTWEEYAASQALLLLASRRQRAAAAKKLRKGQGY
eukprot:GFYU01014636.1.p1 GENE.GFYU01014636.1~~GFYU01014636.1.p1  ORF type:complete len:213 (+),score=66.06 GFYU01014636.1:194-832(+)